MKLQNVEEAITRFLKTISEREWKKNSKLIGLAYRIKLYARYLDKGLGAPVPQRVFGRTSKKH